MSSDHEIRAAMLRQRIYVAAHEAVDEFLRGTAAAPFAGRIVRDCAADASAIVADDLWHVLHDPVMSREPSDEASIAASLRLAALHANGSRPRPPRIQQSVRNDPA